MTDNELREEVRNIEVHQKDGTVKKLVEVVPVYTIGLIEDLIKQHTEKRAASELEAIRSAMTEFAKMGDREWFSIAGLKYINDRLNQLKIANDISPEARRKLKQYADKVKESK